jgi:hypothetical protein
MQFKGGHGCDMKVGDLLIYESPITGHGRFLGVIIKVTRDQKVKIKWILANSMASTTTEKISTVNSLIEKGIEHADGTSKWIHIKT